MSELIREWGGVVLGVESVNLGVSNVVCEECIGLWGVMRRELLVTNRFVYRDESGCLWRVFNFVTRGEVLFVGDEFIIREYEGGVVLLDSLSERGVYVLRESESGYLDLERVVRVLGVDTFESDNIIYMFFSIFFLLFGIYCCFSGHIEFVFLCLFALLFICGAWFVSVYLREVEYLKYLESVGVKRVSGAAGTFNMQRVKIGG